MGSVTTDTEIILPEIRLRSISTANRARGLRKKVFQNPLVCKEAKVNVLQALLITRNTYHVGTWPTLHHNEYQAFKVAIIRLYKLLMVQDERAEEEETKKWDSDEAVCIAVDLPHPAVLVRYFRLCTGIRLAAKAPKEFWVVLYAARAAKRSWLEALMSDLKWLQQHASTFSLVNVSDLQEFMVLAASPVVALRAIRKACFAPEAVTAALADMPMVVKMEIVQVEDEVIAVPVGDEQTVHQCTDCDYSCDSKKQLLCHSRVTHGHRHPVNRCVDTTYCLVCGLDRHTRAGILAHLQDRTPICRLNLLKRGPHVSEEAAEALALEAAAQRTGNSHGGRDKHFAERKCVRIYGPFLPVLDLNGDVIQARNGHPLGPNRAWNRPARLDAPMCKRFLFGDRGPLGCMCADCTAMAPRARACPASLRVQCTADCALCRGMGLDPQMMVPA